ncbi:ribonuclease H [Trichonephila clavipes]|uniref:Ribonuclease H n=1 Tax=Trichonephila clavipes TaxID=2585209 RepID=A0A8X6SQ85_TRICX|nr:ribonuclease H [Trichonephila clavipes]
MNPNSQNILLVFGVTLDSELRFTKHIEQTTIKALRKLNILRNLCGTTWGSRPRTLKNAYSSIIRPVLEYSVSSKQKLDSIQHRASKIIIGAISTKNEKAEREWGLPPLECSALAGEKKEDARILKQKGLETIEKISQENFAVAYTDGSSDISLNKGGAGILFQLPNKERKMHKINTWLIASNFTSELLAIKEALILYSTHLELSGTTQGLAIFSDSRAALEAIIKGDTNITSAISVLIENANAVANYKLLPHRYKKPLIVDFDCSRNVTSIIASLRTGHFKGMKISSDKTRTYISCKNCTEVQLTPDHILECPPFTPFIIRLGMVPLASELREILYSADAPRHAEAVQRSHDII